MCFALSLYLFIYLQTNAIYSYMYMCSSDHLCCLVVILALDIHISIDLSLLFRVECYSME